MSAQFEIFRADVVKAVRLSISFLLLVYFLASARSKEQNQRGVVETKYGHVAFLVGQHLSCLFTAIDGSVAVSGI